LASYAFSPAISAGASGAIFGLAGALTVYFLKYRDNFGRQGRAILQNMLVVIAINLVFGMTMSGIDNWGHIGGLVGGAATAWGVLPRYKTPAVVRLGPQELETEARMTSEMMWVFILAALILAGVIFVTQRGAPTQF
jgi:membrane associated rhomboid family serine protease